MSDEDKLWLNNEGPAGPNYSEAEIYTTSRENGFPRLLIRINGRDSISIDVQLKPKQAKLLAGKLLEYLKEYPSDATDI